MKTSEQLNLDFLNEVEILSELSMTEIKGGRSVKAYQGCGNHHDGTEAASKLVALV